MRIRHIGTTPYMHEEIAVKKSLTYGFVTTVMAVGMAFGTAGVANAAHCAQDGSVGFSYFGQDGREEGLPRGASACPTSPAGNPQDRAPGQQ